jgi:hypothetical protein
VTELLLKDQLDLQRRAAERVDWQQLSDQRERHAVLQTLFEAHVRRFEEAQGRAVSQEDLKGLRREFSDRIKEEIVQMHVDIDKSNAAWAEKILTGAKALNSEAQIQRMDEQRRFRQQLLLAIFAATLSIVGALFVFYETSRPN